MIAKRALYFGCRGAGEAGHYLQEGRKNLYDSVPTGCPWNIGNMDNGLLKNGRHPDRDDGRVFWTCAPYTRMSPSAKWRFDPSLPDQPGSYVSDRWPEWAPEKRHALPDYVPDVAAGASAPIQLTEWKIKALKLAILLERNGKVFRSDFKALGLDARRWTDGHWLAVTPDGLVPGTGFPDFKKMHPKVYDKIAADFDKWSPKQDGLRL